MSQDPKLDDDLDRLLAGLIWGMAAMMGLGLLVVAFAAVYIALHDVGAI